jgi:hypothetical protein
VSWTKGKTDYLEKHYASMSAAAIGAKIGMTRNSVIGKAFRLGLTKSARAIKPKARRSRRSLREILANMDAPIPEGWKP